MEIKTKEFELILTQVEINDLEGELFSVMTNHYDKEGIYGGEAKKKFEEEHTAIAYLYKLISENRAN